MQKLTAVRTPAAAQDLFDALCRAYVKYFGRIPSKQTLMLLLAQWAFETGWGMSMYCYNLANVKTTPGSTTHNWCFYRCNELYPIDKAQQFKTDPLCALGAVRGDKQIVWFNPDHPVCCFRAFLSLDDGAFDYLSELVKKFSDPVLERNAWHWAIAGSTKPFCHALCLKHFYTDDENHYTVQITDVLARLLRMGLSMQALADAQALLPDTVLSLNAFPPEDPV